MTKQTTVVVIGSLRVKGSKYYAKYGSIKSFFSNKKTILQNPVEGTCKFYLLSCLNKIIFYSDNLISCLHKSLSCSYNLTSCLNNLIPCLHNLISCPHNIISSLDMLIFCSDNLVSCSDNLDCSKYESAIRVSD